MKILLVVGLPCSGKTTFLNTLKDYYIIDDITDLSEIPQDSGINIAVSDVHFCMAQTLEKAKTYFKKSFPDYNIDVIYFENAPKKCINNYFYRNDNRKVLSMINSLSKIYAIPKNSKILTIWQS